MSDKIYEVEPIYDGIDEDGERRRLPRNEVVLTKQQLSRFRSASEKLHGNDRAYNRASYAHFFLKLFCRFDSGSSCPFYDVFDLLFFLCQSELLKM
mgnify:CR=1 FL=1